MTRNSGVRTTVAVLASVMLAGAAHAATKFYPGVVKREYFGNLAGTVVTDLTSASKFQQNLPDEVDFPPQLESPDYSPARDNYGGRMSGFIIPTQSGSYRFYVSGDDQTILYLSTDASAANKVEIAREPAWNGTRDYATGNDNAGARPTWDRPGCQDGDPATDCENESNPIQLTASQRYYVEVLWKEGGGGDHASVTWVSDGDTVANNQDPIQAADIGVEASDAATILGGPFASRSYLYTGDKVTLSASLYRPPGDTSSIQWFKDGVAVADATNGSFEYTSVAADGGKDVKFKVKLGALESSEVAVKVITPEAPVLSPGFVNAEFFTDITGTAVQGLLDADKFINNQPDAVLVRNLLSTPDGWGENYGARLSGFILPQETGQYRFFLRSDDASQFYLNPTANGAAPVPGTDAPIAEETACCNAFTEPDSPRTSEPVQLTAGQKYAFVALVKEGGGGDFLQLAWRKEGDTKPAGALPIMAGPIIGGTVQAAGFSVAITKQPQVPSGPVAEGRTATLSATAVASPDPSFLYYQWQLNGTDIPGANNSSYVIPSTLAVGAYKYRVFGATVGDRRATSDEITINVVPDTFPPAPSAGVLKKGTKLEIGIGFDEPVQAAEASAQANYSVSPGTIESFRFVPQSGHAVLTVAGVAAGQTVTITVKNVKDAKGNAIPAAGATTTATLASTMAWVAIGGDEANVRTGTTNYPDDAAALGEGDFDLVSGGSAYWDNYDEATFVYEEITGDFDRKVRVEYQDPTSQWARTGLMLREALDEGVQRSELFDYNNPDANPNGKKMAQDFTIRVNPTAGAIDPATETAIPGNNSYEIVHRPRQGWRYGGTGEGVNALYNIQSGFGGVPPYPNAWMRLQREGQTVRTWKSEDGVNWGTPATVTYVDDPETPEDERLTDLLYVGCFYGPEFFNNAIIPDGGTPILTTSGVAKFREYGPVGGGGNVPTISIARDGANVKITYTGTLQSADEVLGTWTDVAGSPSPATIPASSARKFYRSKN